MKSIVKSILVLFTIILIGLVYGCEESCCDDTFSFGNSICHGTKETCRDTADHFDCSSWKFRPGPTEFCKLEAPEGLCSYNCCCKNAFGLRLFEFSDKIPFFKIIRNKENCDFLAKGNSITESSEICEDESDYRICNSFEFIQPEDDQDLNSCWLSECQDCVLE